MVESICEILKITRPVIVYTHNLADKHPTHIGVAVKTLDAIRRLPAEERPGTVLGCEVWRDLDWLTEKNDEKEGNFSILAKK